MLGVLKQNQKPSAHFVGIKEKTQHAHPVVIYFAGFAFCNGCRPKKNALYVEKMYSLLESCRCSILNKYQLISSITQFISKIVQIAKYMYTFRFDEIFL